MSKYHEIKQYFKSKSVIVSSRSNNFSNKSHHLSSILIILTLTIYYFAILHHYNHLVACQSTQKATYVFPQNPQRFPQNHNSNQQQARYGGQSQYNHAIYINPNPSPRSQGYQLMPAVESLIASNDHKKRGASAADYFATKSTANQSSQSINSGKSDQSQIADWPFVKSLQTVRNNYKAEQFRELQVTTASSPTPTNSPTSIAPNKPSSNEPAESVQPPISQPSSQSGETVAPKTSDNDIKSNWQYETSTTTTTSSSSTTPMPTTEVSREEEEATTTNSTSQQDTTTSSSLIESTKLDSFEQSTTTTTTQAPRMIKDPLFIPEFHSSIQKAVNGLVKMSAESMAKATTESPPPPNTMVSVEPPYNAGLSRNYGLRSSLSLNVLLKNFGIHNLTNFDQILLRSSLRNNDTSKSSSKEPLNFADQKIEINGLHNINELVEKPTDQMPKIMLNNPMDSYHNEDGTANNEQVTEQAECKIEYTMKHVNITLLNGSKRDYTCDYIIDRKLATSKSGIKPTNLDISKICKLQLTSKYFSNQVISEEQDKNRQDNFMACNGTYLSVRQVKFCYLNSIDSNEGENITLNRVFEFPIESDAFDIKVVHKHMRGTNEIVEDSSETEIHLEIKPLMSDDCQTNSSKVEAQPEHPAQSRPRKASLDTTMSYTSTTTTTVTPSTSESPRVSNAARELRYKNNSSTSPLEERGDLNRVITVVSNPRRKFVIKLPQDKQLHPLNNRFKVSQSFDINTTPHLYTQAANRNNQQHATRGGTNQFELCDGIQHSSTIGQISSPEYPRYYAANINCSFLIKRTSSNYCRLLLHFRDFDLINESSQNDVSSLSSNANINNNCLDDYLLIGETRYCNKYAMIGHKMKLDFPEVGPDQMITLTFRSDHMRSGRGFLIKYQQLPCRDEFVVPQSAPVSIWHHKLLYHGNQQQQQQIDGRRTTELPTTLIGGNYAPSMQDHTIAPPMQQPDFSLALKTTTPSSSQSIKNNNRKSSNKISASNDLNSSSQNLAKFNEKSMTSSINRLKSSQNSDNEVRNKVVEKPTTNTTTNSSGNLTPMASTVSSAMSLRQPQQVGTITGGDLQGRSMDKRSTQCNQVNAEASFILTSPNYPEPYSNNLECMYYIRQNSSQVCYIEVTFIKFDLEADKDCRYDYVEINNVRLCGSLQNLPHKTTRIYLFNEPLKIIKFKSDDSGTKAGFLMRIDQLKCAPNGSILRQSKALDIIVTEPGNNEHEGRSALSRTSQATIEKLPLFSSANSTTPLSSTSKSALIMPLKTNSSRTFEYDSQFGRWPSPQTTSNKLAIENSSLIDKGSNSATQRMQSQFATSNEPKSNSITCDDLFYGKEVVIKSPLWPDSYSIDDSISMCRYTIVRDLSGRNKICQLELRFVNLRLGVSDCIDVDGYEVLCGFNTRNMVKYYPFDRQSHLTITFFTGTAKFSSARSISSSSSATDSSVSSDLLPVRVPLKFMIIAKQHECIDGFLAPQIEIGGGYNQTNLLYSDTPRFVNKTSPIIASSFPILNARNNDPPVSQTRMSTSQRGPLESTNKDSLLKYDFSSSSVSPLSSSKLAASKKQTSDSSGSTLLYSTSSTDQLSPIVSNNNNNSLLKNDQNSKQGTRKLTNLATPQPVCFDNSVIKTEDQLFSANYPLSYYENSHCLVSFVRQSDNYCYIQVEIIDLDLDSRSKFCESDYIQFNYGERYCNMEQVEKRLNNAKLVLPFDKSTNFKANILFHSNRAASRRGFLMRHKQLECNEGIQQTTANQTNDEFKLIDRVPLAAISRNQFSANNAAAPPSSDNLESQKCLVQFAQYNGIMSSTSILSKLRTNYPYKYDCEVKLKLLPGFCHALLTFGEFELGQRYRGYCLEYLELDNIQYCGRELKNTNQTLSVTDLNNRTINLKYSTTNTSNIFGFRAIFKQLECNPEPLKTLGELSATNLDSQNPSTSIKQAVLSDAQQVDQKSKSQLGEEVGPKSSSNLGQVEFKEIVLRKEFFELNSAKLVATPETINGRHYEPNMFVVHRIKKLNPNVCKLRLMFYRFDLEPSTGCRRDFLDINNVDRLCGQLGKPENTRRDYDWLSERDFLISFVSDSSIEHEGFLIFGQQVQTNCSSSSPQPPVPTATFDEELKQPDLKANSMISTKDLASKQQEQTTGGQIETAIAKVPSTITNNDDGKCFSLHYEQKFDLSSPNWPQKYSSKTTCYYLIHKSEPDICSVTFNLLSMILGPEESEILVDCDTSNMDNLEIDNQVLCGFISKPRVINIDFNKRQFISVKFSSISGNGFGFFIDVKQNRCKSSNQAGQSLVLDRDQPATIKSSTSNEQQLANNKNRQSSVPGEGESHLQDCNQLLTSDLTSIESENFPNHYRHNLDCLYAVRRTNQSICAIDIVMNHFDLEDQSNSSGLCESDFLEIDYTRFCGYYPLKHKLRFNYFGDELDKFIKFHSDASLARTGFSLTISQVSECSSGSSTTKLESPSASARADSRQFDSSSSTTSPVDDEIINYLPTNMGGSSTSSNSSSMQPQKADSESSSSSSSSVEAEQQHSTITSSPNNSSSASINEPLTQREFNTLCQFTYHKEQQYLLSPNYNEQRRSYDNNMDCLYKIVARGYEFCSLKLTIVDLDLESSSDCHNDYLLIDNQRYCGRNSRGMNNNNRTNNSAEQQVIEVQFADILPREIDLLYHTNAHVNEGRGFKLYYEQRACESSDDQNFRLQNGDMRLNFRNNQVNQSGNLHNNRAQSNDANNHQVTSFETREARRLKFGQLSYPKNYVTSSHSDKTSRHRQSHHSIPSSKHNEPSSNAQRKQDHVHLGTSSNMMQTDNRFEPDGSSGARNGDRLLAMQQHNREQAILNHRRDSWREIKPQIISTAAATATNKQRGDDLDKQHDDLTLRKEIVVVRTAPKIMAH